MDGVELVVGAIWGRRRTSARSAPGRADGRAPTPSGRRSAGAAGTRRRRTTRSTRSPSPPQVITTLQHLVSRRSTRSKPAVVTVTSVHAGTADNIIPGGASSAAPCGRSTRRSAPDPGGDRARSPGRDRGARRDVQFDYEEGYAAVVNDARGHRLAAARASATTRSWSGADHGRRGLLRLPGRRRRARSSGSAPGARTRPASPPAVHDRRGRVPVWHRRLRPHRPRLPGLNARRAAVRRHGHAPSSPPRVGREPPATRGERTAETRTDPCRRCDEGETFRPQPSEWAGAREDACRAAYRLGRDRRDRYPARGRTRGAVPRPAVRGGAPPAGRDRRRPAPRGQPCQGPACRRRVHDRQAGASRGDARSLPAVEAPLLRHPRPAARLDRQGVGHGGADEARRTAAARLRLLPAHGRDRVRGQVRRRRRQRPARVGHRARGRVQDVQDAALDVPRLPRLQDRERADRQRNRAAGRTVLNGRVQDRRADDRPGSAGRDPSRARPADARRPPSRTRTSSRSTRSSTRPRPSTVASAAR